MDVVSFLALNVDHDAQEPVIALHVRHGDKLKEANRLSVSDYQRVVSPLAKVRRIVTCFPFATWFAEPILL